MRPARPTPALLAVGLLCALATACSDAPATPVQAGADAAVFADTATASDTFVNNWVQGYSVRLAFHGGPADGRVWQLERDLYGAEKTVFAFGSTHLTFPAISFAMTDDIPELMGADGKVAQPKLQFQLGLGLLVESANNFPAHTPKAGKYAFSCSPPLLRVTYKDIVYKSSCPDLAGEIEVTHWAKDASGRMAGRFAGKLRHYLSNPQFTDDCDPSHVAHTCNKNGAPTTFWVDVEGHFGFELPPPDGGKAP